MTIDVKNYKLSEELSVSQQELFDSRDEERP
jgi:hypothetical protein